MEDFVLVAIVDRMKSNMFSAMSEIAILRDKL